MKKRKKLNKAQRELDADWEKLQQKWANVGKFSRINAMQATYKSAYGGFGEDPRQTDNRSVMSRATPGGDTPMRNSMEYTGTSMVGLATMHKSNTVPIFNTDAAKDVASMRR